MCTLTALSKTQLVGQHEQAESAAVRVFVPRVDEFSSLIRSAEQHPDCKVLAGKDYDIIQASGPIEFERKALGLKPALWYGMFTGGLHGRIERFDRDIVRLVPLQG